MMLRKGMFALLLFSMSAFAQLSEISSEAVRHYLEGRTAAMQANATPQDVEKAVSGVADDAVYEHPAFKARVEGRENMRKNMLGFFGSTRNARLKVTKAISTANLVVVEMQMSFEAEKEGKWLPTSRRQVLLFELKDNKIERIVEYWE